MNVYLKELSQEIKEDFYYNTISTLKLINILSWNGIIIDGAGWHKSNNLIIPKNIQIILLPPYCQKLNCIDRLLEMFIKDNIIKNKVFETLIELENQVC